MMKRTAFVAILLAIVASVALNWAPPRANAQAGTELLQLLPDGGGVAVIDVQRVTTSNLWAAFSSQQKVKEALDKAHNEISDLGVRLSDIRTVAVVFPSTGSKDITGAISGSFNQTDLLARMRTNQKIKLTSEKYKSFDIYNVVGVSTDPAKPGTESKNDGATFTFIDSSTVVIGSVAGVRASLDTRAGGRSVAQNAKLAAAIAENPAAAIRFALDVPPGMTKSLQSGGLPLPDFSSINMVFGAVDVTAGIDLVATLRNDTAEHAKAIADQLNSLLGMAKGFLGASQDPKMSQLAGMLDTLKVEGNGVDVRITGSVSQEALNQVLSQIK
jgi:hypothetical protein